MELTDESITYEILKNPYNWNTYYIWKDKIEYKNYNHPQDYSSPGSMEYFELIMKGFDNTIKINESFEEKFKS
jgi:hypothetical protein